MNNRVLHLIVIITSSILAVSCATTPVSPQSEELAPFTAELLASQPDDAFTAVYPIGDEKLIWLGAKHENQLDSLTFQLIADAYEQFSIDTVIIEGVETSQGPSPQPLLESVSADAAKARDGFQPGGETVPTVLGAVRGGAVVIGGEPDDKDILRRLIQQGLTEADILGFYTMRSIPQWIRERQITDASDPKIEPLLLDELEWNRSALDIPKNVLPDVEAWRGWYKAKNGKPLGADFTTEEAGPRADGRFGTNEVGSAISRARASHLHELVLSHLNSGETVFVVYGASHLMIHRPALDAALGDSCYLGRDLKEVAQICSN